MVVGWAFLATSCVAMIACVPSVTSSQSELPNGSLDSGGEDDAFVKLAEAWELWRVCGLQDDQQDDVEASGVRRQGGGAAGYQLPPPIPVKYFVEWALDGSEIVFSAYHRRTYQAMYAVEASGTRLRELHVGEASQPYGYGVHADLSPDGSLLTYTTCEYRAEDAAEAVTDQASRESPHLKDLKEEEKHFRFYEIGTVKIDGTTRERLTTNLYNDFFPAWSPRGDAIAFLADPTDPGGPGTHRSYDSYREFRIMSADGGDGKSMVVIGEEDLRQRATGYSASFVNYPPQWSPDGQRVAVVVGESSERALFPQENSGNLGLYIVNGGGRYGRGAPTPKRLLGSAVRLTATVGGASWSPDGARIALMQIVDDDVALVTIAADGSDDLEVITRLTDQEVQDMRHVRPIGGGLSMVLTVSWSPDGRHILFRCGERLCVVGLDGERVGAWPLEFLGQETLPQAAWSPDGSRLAVVGEFDAGPISDDPSYRTVLFTMAPDGTDVRFLVGGRPGKGKLEALGARRVETPMTSGFCSLGEAVQYPDAEANANEVRDCETLLRLRDTLAGSPLLDWGAKHKRPQYRDRRMSEWEGVTVLRPLGYGRVYELELPERRLAGTVPAELSGLSELTRLSLPRNNLHGSIPAELGQLTNLTHLDLSDNELTGPIPAELSQLVNLEVLYLGGNHLTGCIPPALHKVPDHDLGSLGLPDCGPG